MNEKTESLSRSRRRKGIIAGVAGAALLLGGSTFALWQDSQLASGGTITSGELAIAPVANATWFDISADRSTHTTDAVMPGIDGTNIGNDVSSYLISPGDSLAARYTTDVTLRGKNLVGELMVSSNGAGSASGYDPSRELAIKYQVFVDGVSTSSDAWQSGTISTTPLSLGFFTEAGSNQVSGADVTALTSGTAEVTVLIRADFGADTNPGTAAGTDDQVSQNAARTIAGLTFKLTQSRDAAHGDFS